MFRTVKTSAVSLVLGVTAAALLYPAAAQTNGQKPKSVPALALVTKGSAAKKAVAVSTTLTLDPAALTPGNVRRLMLKYLPKMTPLSSSRPAGITKEPAYKGTVRYGVVRVGNGPNAAYLLAVDDPESGGGKLYIDANRNGDLTDDGDGAWAGEAARDGIVGYGATHRVLRASWGTADRETSSGPYALNFYYRQGGETLGYYRGAARVGTLTVNGTPHSALLIENDSDAVFHKPAGTKHAPVWLLLETQGASPSRRLLTVNEPFALDGAAYEAAISEDGSRLALRPSRKPLPAAAAPPPPAAPLLAVGARVPDFTADLPGGGTINLAQHRGKVVVLDFWATWCGPCMASMPHLEQVYQKLKGRDDAAVLALCVSDERAAFDKWVAANRAKYTFPFAFDPAGRDASKNISRSQFGVTGIPTTFVIARDGTVAASIVGYGGENDHRLEEALRKLGIAL